MLARITPPDIWHESNVMSLITATRNSQDHLLHHLMSPVAMLTTPQLKSIRPSLAMPPHWWFQFDKRLEWPCYRGFLLQQCLPSTQSDVTTWIWPITQKMGLAEPPTLKQCLCCRDPPLLEHAGIGHVFLWALDPNRGTHCYIIPNSPGTRWLESAPWPRCWHPKLAARAGYRLLPGIRTTMTEQLEMNLYIFSNQIVNSLLSFFLHSI